MRGSRLILIRIASAALILLAWWLLTATGIVSAKILPSPQAFIEHAFDAEVNRYAGVPLHQHILSSVERTAVGFGAAVLIAVPLGLVIGYSQIAEAITAPVLNYLRPIPAISFIPLVVLYFGIGEFSKVFVIFLTTSLYLVVNVAAGVKAVPVDLLRVGRALGLSRAGLFAHVVLPGSMPGIVTGLRVAVAVSWTLVVAAELISAQSGLGFIIEDASTFYRLPEVYVAISIIGLIGVILEGLVALLERRVLHWLGR